MIIINKHTNKNTLQSCFMVHYVRHNKIMQSTEKLSEKAFNDFKKQLLKGHKEIILFNVVSVSALKAIQILDINLI